jgi:hypothetical protein
MTIKTIIPFAIFLIFSRCNSDDKGYSKINDSLAKSIIDSEQIKRFLPNNGKDGAVALVIGQSKYENVRPLTYPEIDADSIADVLKSFGIEVIKITNANKSLFMSALKEWAAKLKEYKVGLIFYSGHGVEAFGRNYLIPTDLPDNIKMDINKEAITLDTILTIMENSNTKMNLVLLDACRDNPFPTMGLGGGGLENQTIPVGTFIGFAASPGRVSYDLGHTNSIYTEGILKFVRYPNISIDQVFHNVNGYVRDYTGGKQTPYANSSLDGDFYFNLSRNSSDIKDLNLEDKRIYSKNIESLFPGNLFGVDVGVVLAGEFGEQYRNAFNYEQLPISTECTNNEIRYYWRKLSESKMYDKLKQHLQINNLDSFITDQSTIFYTFRNNKLFRLAINFYFTNVKFHRKFLNSLGIGDDKYWGKFYDYEKDFYTIIDLNTTYNQTSVFFGSGDSYSYCNNDWFSNIDTLNISN